MFAIYKQANDLSNEELAVNYYGSEYGRDIHSTFEQMRRSYENSRSQNQIANIATIKNDLREVTNNFNGHIQHWLRCVKSILQLLISKFVY